MRLLKLATRIHTKSLATLKFYHIHPTLFQLVLLTFIRLTILPEESQKCDFPDFVG